MATRYEEGDVVATPDGRGVVAAVLTEQFYFPQEGGEDEYEQVSATSDQPAYVVGLESVGSAPYRASRSRPPVSTTREFPRSRANDSQAS